VRYQEAQVTSASQNVDRSETKMFQAKSGIFEHSSKDVHSHADAVAIVSLDTLGMAASTICLIHCMIMPLIMSSLPLLGLKWHCLNTDTAHRILAFFVIAFALSAIVPGYLKHRHSNILASMIAGLSLVLIATFACGFALPEALEVPLITVGNLILVATHWQNRKLSDCKHLH